MAKKNFEGIAHGQDKIHAISENFKKVFETTKKEIAHLVIAL